MTATRNGADIRTGGGTWAILCAAVLWGVLGSVARFALDDGVRPLNVAFWRAGFAAMLFALHSAVTRAAPLRREDRSRAVALGVGGVALLYVAYLESVQRGGAALAAILLYSAPLWVALGARVLYRERISPLGALALFITLVGVAVVALSGGGASTITLSVAGLTWGLASGATYALYYLLGRRLFAHNAPSRVMAWALAIGSLAMLPFVQFDAVTSRAWIAMLMLAVVSTYAAYLAYAYGLQRMAPSKAATIATLEPVVAVVAAFVLWGEKLSVQGLAGAAIVIAGVILSSRAPAAKGVT